MNIDELKLQPEDLRGINVIFKHVYEAPVEDIAKTAQLKLLEWMRGICIEHDHVKIVGSIEDYKDAGCPQFRRMECSECMSELESKLKEGR